MILHAELQNRAAGELIGGRLSASFEGLKCMKSQEYDPRCTDQRLGSGEHVSNLQALSDSVHACIESVKLNMSMLHSIQLDLAKTGHCKLACRYCKTKTDLTSLVCHSDMP